MAQRSRYFVVMGIGLQTDFETEPAKLNLDRSTRASSNRLSKRPDFALIKTDVACPRSISRCTNVPAYFSRRRRGGRRPLDPEPNTMYQLSIRRRAFGRSRRSPWPSRLSTPSMTTSCVTGTSAYVSASTSRGRALPRRAGSTRYSTSSRRRSRPDSPVVHAQDLHAAAGLPTLPEADRHRRRRSRTTQPSTAPRQRRGARATNRRTRKPPTGARRTPSSCAPSDASSSTLTLTTYKCSGDTRDPRRSEAILCELARRCRTIPTWASRVHPPTTIRSTAPRALRHPIDAYRRGFKFRGMLATDQCRPTCSTAARSTTGQRVADFMHATDTTSSQATCGAVDGPNLTAQRCTGSTPPSAKPARPRLPVSRSRRLLQARPHATAPWMVETTKARLRRLSALVARTPLADLRPPFD